MITLPKGSILKFDGNSVTEHNRSELEIGSLEIALKERMANGDLRKQFIANKRKFSVSWDKCPAVASKTVDGKWGGREIRAFYDSVADTTFLLTVTYGDGTEEIVQVMFEDFSHVIQKRTQFDLWSINMSLEEV